MEMESVTINGVEYVPKGAESKAERDGLPYVVVRGTNSGAFAGYLHGRNGSEVDLRDARRLWYWDGAASLSQLAIDGVSKPENCKFPAAVDVEILDSIEVIAATEKARQSIESVEVWSA